MSAEKPALEAAMAALEAQRATLGDAVVEALLAPARAQLQALSAASLAEAEPAQTLRQVSILFMDVVGSTALAQGLDPEGISAVLDGALNRGTAIVQAHRGRVLQYAGDNILAVFGADASREDDAERAVLCGLALLELGRTLGDEVRAAHGHPGFDVRVGVHTGGVLLGGGVAAEGSIRGNAVHIAARMEQTAPAGTLRISHDTYAQVRGLFEVQDQPPLVVKGVASPVRSYRVLHAKPRQFRIVKRGVEGVDTRLVGRDAEFGVLRAAFRRLFEHRALRAVTIVAEAGVGKSRLLHEFEIWSEEQPERFCLFRGRATPQTATQAFGLLRDLMAWRFQIADDDSLDVARAKMEGGMVPLFLADEGPERAEAHAHLLGHLIGIDWKDSRHIRGILDDPRQIRSRGFQAATQVIRRMGGPDGSPTVLQLEDLHWADPETLDFLDHLAEVSRNAPLLVIVTTRPMGPERGPSWPFSDPQADRIALAPLDEADSRALADELLQKLPETPPALRELLSGSAAGNPFYMEELLKMLIDQGAIHTGPIWTVNAERLLLTTLPSTLTGVLQARLDGLPPREKHALQQASIVGADFWDQALAAVDAGAVESLPSMVQRELVLPRPDAAPEGWREYGFRHHLLHQVTYDTVLSRNKRSGHARVAQWLAAWAESGGLRARDFVGMAAEHFERACDSGRAAEFHARAAEQALARFAHERVLAHVGRALNLLGTAGGGGPADQAELRWRLLAAREKTLHIQARRDEQLADLEALAQIAEALDDDRRRAQVAQRRAMRAMRMGDWAAMEAAARLSRRCAFSAGDVAARLHATRLQARARLYVGAIESGCELATEALAEARSLGLRGVEASLNNVLSIAAEMRGDLVASRDFDRESLQIYREVGDRINEATCQSNLGLGCLTLGDLKQARQELEAALQMMRAHGDRAMECLALCYVSLLALREGDPAQAQALATSALETAVSARARDVEVIAWLRLGDAEAAAGRPEAADKAYGQARVRAIDIGDPRQHDASAGLARTALHRGRPDLAWAALQPLFDHAGTAGLLEGTDDQRLIELTCYQVLTEAEDPRAAAWLARAHDALMTQARAIQEPGLREGYLGQVPHHRDIVAAWAAWSAAPPGGLPVKGREA